MSGAPKDIPFEKMDEKKFKKNSKAIIKEIERMISEDKPFGVFIYQSHGRKGYTAGGLTKKFTLMDSFEFFRDFLDKFPNAVEPMSHAVATKVMDAMTKGEFNPKTGEIVERQDLNSKMVS